MTDYNALWICADHAPKSGQCSGAGGYWRAGWIRNNPESEKSAAAYIDLHKRTCPNWIGSEND